MSSDELEFFGSKLSELDTVNRTYTWRILFDHVKMGKLAPSKFKDIVLQKLPTEQNEKTLLFVFQKISWLTHLGFIDKHLMKPADQVTPTSEEPFLNQLFTAIFKS